MYLLKALSFILLCQTPVVVEPQPIEKKIVTIETDNIDSIQGGKVLDVSIVQTSDFPEPDLKITGADEPIDKGELVVLGLAGDIPQDVKKVDVKWVILKFDTEKFSFKEKTSKSDVEDREVYFGAGIEDDTLQVIASVSYHYVKDNTTTVTSNLIRKEVQIGDGLKPGPTPVPPNPVPPTPVPVPPNPVPVPPEPVPPGPVPPTPPSPVDDVLGFVKITKGITLENEYKKAMAAGFQKSAEDLIDGSKYGQIDKDVNETTIAHIFTDIYNNNLNAVKSAGLEYKEQYLKDKFLPIQARAYEIYLECKNNPSQCKMRKIADIVQLCKECAYGLGV